MDRDAINEYLESIGESVLLADGFDEAMIGVSQRMNEPLLAVYSYDKMIDVLIERDGLDYEEATEYLDFNVLGAWVGEKTPIIVTSILALRQHARRIILVLIFPGIVCSFGAGESFATRIFFSFGFSSLIHK